MNAHPQRQQLHLQQHDSKQAPESSSAGAQIKFGYRTHPAILANLPADNVVEAHLGRAPADRAASGAPNYAGAEWAPRREAPRARRKSDATRHAPARAPDAARDRAAPVAGACDWRILVSSAHKDAREHEARIGAA